MKMQLIFEMDTNNPNDFFNGLKAALIECAQPYAHATNTPIDITEKFTFTITDPLNLNNRPNLVPGNFFLSNQQIFKVNYD